MNNTQEPRFRHYAQNQLMLLPPSLDELIDEHHPVRVVNHIIDQLDLSLLIKAYPGGGSPSYHPKMLLKLVVYAYLNNIYSSRKMEAATRENIHFMWLLAMNRPDHNTISRFRSDRLLTPLPEIFKQIVLLLADQGLLDIDHLYIDGTKVLANAGRYSFVWRKSLEKNKAKLISQIQEIFAYAQNIAAQELQDDPPPDPGGIDAGQLEQTIERIEQALRDKPVDKQMKARLRQAKSSWVQRLADYDDKLGIVGSRGSFSKTDSDATFMRTKDDHLGTGQLKACYNIQLGTHDQFVISYSVHNTADDTTTLIPHLSQYEHLYGTPPKSISTDAGYGSQQNYEHAEKSEITAFVKYAGFDTEQGTRKKKKKHKPKPFSVDKLYYNKDKNCYYCPMGQPMGFIGTVTSTSATGYQQQQDLYQAQNCRGCPLRGVCHESKGNRVVRINRQAEHYRAKARELLISPEGIKHRKKRGWDVETVFGNIKANHGFTRFSLRSKPKIEIELGLLAISQNLRKLAS